MKVTMAKILAALCLITLASYVFAGADGAGSFGPRHKPGVHKKSPSARKHAQAARGSKGQSGFNKDDSIPTPTPTATPTPTPSTDG
jgi:hypothetical protein